MNIPLLDLKREYDFLKDRIWQEVDSCMQSQRWILGSKVTELEERITDYLGGGYACGVASGTDALILSLSALSLQRNNSVFFSPEQEIITTPFTFLATAEAIVRTGARPVFVDVNKDTCNIDLEKVAAAVNKNTVGILPVHLYGQPATMEEINQIAASNDLFVLEDAAQAFGADYRQRKVGALADIAAFSFFPSKNLGAYGDGGMVTSKSSKLVELIRVLRNHGQTDTYRAQYLGFNSRLDSLQAAILLVKLHYIDKFNQKRIQLAARYNQAFANIPQIQTPNVEHRTSNVDSQDHNVERRTSNVDSQDHNVERRTSNVDSQDHNVERRTGNVERTHIYHLYTIKVEQHRDQLLDFLNQAGIAARVYYPHLVSDMAAFKNNTVIGELSNSRELITQVISLPLYPFIKTDEQDYIIDKVAEFFRSL